MKKCPSCGFITIKDDFDFCEKCGAMYPKEGNPAQPSSASMALSSNPLDRGFELMQYNNFVDGSLSWIEAFKDESVVDDVTYSRMVEECAGCLLRIVLRADEYARARLPDLAVALEDRELITDIMDELVKNRGICTLQTGMLGLLSEYMLLFVDCFAVYTDLRDLMRICESSENDLKPFVDQSYTLPAPDGMKADWGARWVENYLGFIIAVKEAMAHTMKSLSDERMEALSDYWASINVLGYKNDLMGALMMNIQLFKSGKITGKMFLKGRDMHITEAFRKYTSVKVEVSEEV